MLAIYQRTMILTPFLPTRDWMFLLLSSEIHVSYSVLFIFVLCVGFQTLSNTVEEKAKWIFNKLKGTWQYMLFLLLCLNLWYGSRYHSWISLECLSSLCSGNIYASYCEYVLDELGSIHFKITSFIIVLFTLPSLDSITYCSWFTKSPYEFWMMFVEEHHQIRVMDLITIYIRSSIWKLSWSKKLKIVHSWILNHMLKLNTLLHRKAIKVVARSPPRAQPPSGPLPSEHNMLWIWRGKVETHSLHVIPMRSLLQGLLHRQVLDPCQGHAVEREAYGNRGDEDEGAGVGEGDEHQCGRIQVR